ncbi:hypothetical protein AUJ84_00255 [Candidatus Pacearchaeota archaeon CG1_02_32_132]|nr:MAG: hypothetical protein AUJ84_00255 [Candidatus Pacearchaeota archaeon CG1_02_32_132]
MKFDFKKIASAVASLAMIGSTVALAAAANYPAPFVKGGVADVGIIYGSGGLDSAAAVNIQSDLSAALAEQSGNGGGAPTGESILLAKASDKLNLRDRVSAVFGTSVTADYLPTLLANGVYANDENTEFDYEQKINIGDEPWALNFFADNDYKSKEPSVGLNFSSGQYVLNYTLTFLDPAESDVSGGDLVDLETTTLRILGKNYYILDAKNATVQFILLDAASSAIVAEGDVTTLTSGGKSYDVSIVFISSSQVKLNINGEDTNLLSSTGTQRLKDGSYVGIKEILAKDVSGNVGKVEFSIGSGKLDLKDGTQVKLNDNTINEVTTTFTKTETSTKVKLDKIVLSWKTDDREFVTPDMSLTMPGLEAIKISMADFVIPNEEITTVINDGTDSMVLKTIVTDGAVTVPLFYANASGEFIGIGESSDKLLVTSYNTSVIFNDTIGDEYLVASWNGSDRDPESYVLRFSGFTRDTNTGINYTNVEKYYDDTWHSYRDTRKTGDTVDLGSLTLTLDYVEYSPNKWVSITGNAGANFHTLYTKSGLKVYLPIANASSYYADVASSQKGVVNVHADWRNGLASTTTNKAIDAGANAALRGAGSWNFQFAEEDKDGDINQGNDFNATLDAQSDGDLEVSSISGSTFSEVEDNNNIVTRLQSDLATKIRRVGSSSVQREAEITYAGAESYGEVYLTGPDTTFSGSSSLGDNVIVTDGDASKVSNKNLIVVGGSCINTVAAKLLGSASPVCGAQWTSTTGIGAGEFLIQTFDNPFLTSGKIATLVAGYEAGDTSNAATFLTTEPVMTDVGKKYKGTSSTSAGLVSE